MKEKKGIVLGCVTEFAQKLLLLVFDSVIFDALVCWGCIVRYFSALNSQRNQASEPSRKKQSLFIFGSFFL